MKKAELVLEVLQSFDERVVRKVIRNKKVIRRVFCKPGFKAVGGKCVRMKAPELRNRKLSQRKAGKRRKVKSHAVANRKRTQSNRLRRSFK